MDPPPSPLARVRQVFWAVLNYVTATVQQYLTPEPVTGNGDTFTGQEATVSVTTETQKWTEGDKHERANNEAEKKMREDRENVADACDSGCEHATTQEQCMISIATETNRKTDQYVVKDIKVKVTEKVIERREIVGNEPTTHIEKEAKGSQFTDEREMERYGTISKHVVQTVHMSRPSYFEEIGRRGQGNTNEDYYQDKSDGEQKSTRQEEKTKDKESGKLFSDGDGEEQTETNNRDRGREEHRAGLVKTGEMKIIRGAEEENEDMRELMEEVVQIMVEDNEMDIKTKDLRSKEGTKQKMQPKGNGEDGGREFKLQLVSGAIGGGDENIKTVEIGRQGGVKEAHAIKEKPKEKTEMVTNLTASGKGELDNKDIGSDRDIMNSGGGKDKERYEEKEGTRKLLIEEQYGEVSGTEEGKKDDVEELASAVESGGTEITHVERGEEKTHACDIKGDKSTGSQKAGQIAKAFNTRGEESGTERERGEEESGENLKDKKTRTEFEGMERDGSQQRTDDDIKNKSECKGRKLETNWDEVGTILIEGAETGDEVNKAPVQEERMELTGAPAGGEESEKYESETEIETGVKIENYVDGWKHVPTKEQKMHKSERGQNGNGAVGRQIEMTNMDGDFKKNELCQTEVAVGNKENEMESIGLRNVETENKELKEIAEECGVVAEEEESKNSMAKGQEEETKTMIEEKQEHERHLIKENKEEPLVGQIDIGHNLDPAVEIEAGAVDEEGDDEGNNDGEEESLIIKEKIEWEHTKEVGKSEYSEEMEANKWGIEEKGEDIPVGRNDKEVRPEPMVPVPVERNDKGVLSEETHSGGERDIFTKETETDTDADEKDVGILSTGEDERITDNGRNENNFRETIVENKEEEQREGEACSEDKDMESVEMRKTETEEKDINKEKDIKDDEGISVEEQRQEGQFSEIMTEGKQRDMGNDFDSTGETETGAVDEEVDDEVGKGGEEECMILKEGTGGKNTKEFGESEYSGEMEASVWSTEEKRDEKEVRPEPMVPVPVERNDKGVLSEETHSGGERDIFTKETETDTDADEKDVGILSTGEDERITDNGRNENNFRETIVENKEEEQREGEACSEDKDMESVEMRKTETEEKDINKEKDIKDDEGISVEEQRQEGQFSEIMTEGKQRDMGNDFDSTRETETGAVDEEVDDEVGKEGEEECMILKEGTGGKNTKEFGESEYSGEIEASVWGTEEKRDEKEVRPEPMVPVPVERNGKGVLSEETHSGGERDIFTKETETDTDADEKDVGILSTGEDERITDNGRNENNFRETIVENKEEEQREGEACSEDKDMESVEMRKTETEEKDINKEKDIKDDEGISVEEQRQEGQFSEIMTEGKQRDMGNDFDSIGETETGAVDEEVDDEVGKEGEEECMILKEGTGGKNTKEFGESEYSGEMEASVWGTEEKRDEKEVRPELMVPVTVDRNEKGVLSEESHSGVERDIFTKETETDTDADEKDVGILSTGEDERIADIGRNENNFRETIVENKEEEQREGEVCGEDKDMNSVEEKDIYKSAGEIEREKSIAETENIETVWQEVEIREEMEDEKGIKAPVEEVCHKGVLEQLVLEEGDEPIREEWKEDIQREKRGGSSNGVQVNVILDGDKQERKDDEGMHAEAQGQFSELKTERKQENRGKDLDPTVEIEGGAVDEEEDAEEEKEKEEEGMILKEETGGENMKEFGESEYSREIEADVWGTEEKRGEKEVRPELMVPVPVERNEKGVLSEESHSGEERDIFTKETETDTDANEKDIGLLSTGEDERIADIGRNENNFRDTIVENKKEEQREGEACSEDKDMESVEMRKTETEEKDINKEKDIKDDEGISVEEQRQEGQFSEIMTEGKQRDMGNDFDLTGETETGAVDEEVDDEVAKEGEEECVILKEGTGGKNTKEFGESEYSGEMEASVWGTEEKRDEKEVRPELMVPVPVERNDNGVLSEESHSGVERDILTKETETDTDADEEDVGILSTGEDERITDMGRNENNFRETIVENKEEEQREGEVCGEDKDMNSVEEKDIYKSAGEIEREKSIAETENIETVWQEVEIREEMEDEKGIKAPVEEVCHKGALEQLVLEEGDEPIREEWKEDIQREKRGGSSNGVQVNVILDGDKQERKDDEGMHAEAQGQFSELKTERKQENRGKDLDPTVEIEGGAVDEEEDAKEEKEKEEEGMILKEETGEKKTKEVGESAYSGEMEASVWGTEEKGDEIEGRPDEVRKVLIGNREIHDTFGIEVAEDNEKAELKGQEVESKEPERNSEVVKPTEIQWEKFDDRATEEKTTTRLDNKETEGLNVEEENYEMKKTIDNWIELHTPSLDFTAQKSRIALKNAHSRPPRNPRSLLNTPSLLPTPSELQQPEKLNVVPMVVKQGGPVISGFKLPGMGGGFPALKRTHRGVREGEGVTAECVYPKNSQAPDATKTLKSDREEVVGGKVVGMGVIGVKLPGFMGEFPGLRKTERGAKVREQTPEKNPPSQNSSTERSDRTGTDSITGVKQMGFGSGFTLLRKTERGLRIREGEDTQHSTQNSEVEVNIPGVDHQETLPKAKPKWTPPGKPGIRIDNPSMISELKNKLRKTE